MMPSPLSWAPYGGEPGTNLPSPPMYAGAAWATLATARPPPVELVSSGAVPRAIARVLTGAGPGRPPRVVDPVMRAIARAVTPELNAATTASRIASFLIVINWHLRCFYDESRQRKVPFRPPT